MGWGAASRSGGRSFQVAVIVRGWEETRGPEYFQRSGHTYFSVSSFKCLSHVEHPCLGIPRLPTDPGLRGVGPVFDPEELKR